MNQNYYIEELTKKVDSLEKRLAVPAWALKKIDSLEKRLAVLEKLLSGDNK